MTATQPALVPQSTRRWFGVVAWGLPLMLMGLGLTSYGLLNVNEGLYAEIAREMSVSGDWIIPHLNGVPYLEKPPLVYWLTATSISLFGPNEFAVRLISVLAGVMCLLGVSRFARRTGTPDEAAMAVLVLGSSFAFVIFSRLAMLDLAMTAGLTWALFAAQQHMANARRRTAVLFGASLALAVLAKGLVALLLFALITGVYALLLPHDRRRRTFHALLSPLAWGTFLVIAAPWHIAAAIRQPDFLWFYFINEHVLRFLGLRQPHDYYSGPWWHYLPRLALAAFPWIAFLCLGAPRAASESARETRRLLILATIAPLILFSLSAAKANYYIVLCLPPLSMLIAQNLAGLERYGRAAVCILVTGIVIVVGFTFAASRLSWFDLVDASARYQLGLTAFATGVLALLAVIALYARKAHIAVVLVALMGAPPIAWLIDRAQQNEAALSARSWISQAPGAVVWIYGDFAEFSGVPFYLRHPVPVIDSRSADLEYGYRHVSDPSALRVPSDQVARDAQGLIFYDREGDAALFHSGLAGRVTRIGCMGHQCVARLSPRIATAPR